MPRGEGVTHQRSVQLTSLLPLPSCEMALWLSTASAYDTSQLVALRFILTRQTGQPFLSVLLCTAKFCCPFASESMAVHDAIHGGVNEVKNLSVGAWMLIFLFVRYIFELGDTLEARYEYQQVQVNRTARCGGRWMPRG